MGPGLDPLHRTTPEYDRVVEALGSARRRPRPRSLGELALVLEERALLLIPEQQEADEAGLEALGKEVADVLRAFFSQDGGILGMSFALGAGDLLRGAGQGG